LLVRDFGAFLFMSLFFILDQYFFQNLAPNVHKRMDCSRYNPILCVLGIYHLWLPQIFWIAYQYFDSCRQRATYLSSPRFSYFICLRMFIT
jgi:hypothetical protein